MFYTKRDASDEIVRYKVQLVAKGYSGQSAFQRDIYPLAKFITIRCIFAIRVAMEWNIHHKNVKTTIFNKILKVKIYMNQPEGFVEEGKKHTVYKL